MNQKEFTAQMERDFNEQGDLYAGQPDVVPEPTTLDYDQQKNEVKRVKYNTPELVHNPSHYQWFGREVIDVIKSTLSTEGYLGFLEGNALKYRLRAADKPGNSQEQDIDKAMVYERYYEDFVKENTLK